MAPPSLSSFIVHPFPCLQSPTQTSTPPHTLTVLSLLLLSFAYTVLFSRYTQPFSPSPGNLPSYIPISFNLGLTSWHQPLVNCPHSGLPLYYEPNHNTAHTTFYLNCPFHYTYPLLTVPLQNPSMRVGTMSIYIFISSPKLNVSLGLLLVISNFRINVSSVNSKTHSNFLISR